MQYREVDLLRQQSKPSFLCGKCTALRTIPLENQSNTGYYGQKLSGMPYTCFRALSSKLYTNKAGFFLPSNISPNSSSYSYFSSSQCSSGFGSVSFFSSSSYGFLLLSQGFLKVAIAVTSPTNATFDKSLAQETPPKTESLQTFEHSPEIFKL